MRAQLLRWPRCAMLLVVAFPNEVWGKICSGGHYCTAPQDCCLQGCCPYAPPPPHSINHYPSANQIEAYNAITASIKYYIWTTLVALALFVGAVWWCKLRGGARACLRDCCLSWECCAAGASTSRASEPDSAGSCYYPPQYSRCGSLCRIGNNQTAPPPYNEVTSKPDLYPMVIYLGADKGSLSAASTADSLSSSYLCNTANEANTLVPPPYSCAGSVEWSCTGTAAAQRQTLLRSISSINGATDENDAPRQQRLHNTTNDNRSNETSNRNNDQSERATNASKFKHTTNKIFPNASDRFQQQQCSSSSSRGVTHHQYFNVWDYGGRSAGGSTNNGNAAFNIDANFSPKSMRSKMKMSRYIDNISSDSFDENDQSHSAADGEYSARAAELSPENQNSNENILGACGFPEVEVKKCNNDDERRRVLREYDDSMMNVSNFNLNSLEENPACSSFFSRSRNLNDFGNSITGSEISSLANLGTPDSPPRATSPTSEIKELLDKIQRLPRRTTKFTDEDENDECHFASSSSSKCYFNSNNSKKSRRSNLYMPLNLVPNSKTFHHHNSGTSPISNAFSNARHFSRRSWLSRSAPTTPCGSGLVPGVLTLAAQQPSSVKTHRSGTKDRRENDDSPLLSGDDNDNDKNV